MKTVSFLALGTSLVAFAAAPVLADTTFENLAYGPGERNVMDLFLPEDVQNPPLVMYIHGGAWFRGDKDQVEDYNRRSQMLDAGLAVATINYTWAQQGIWPAQKNDLDAAIRFLQDNAATYGYDMARFTVWGQSSGAHLALWTAVMDAQDPSLGVDAVVSWYAPSDLHALWQDRIDDDVPGANERERTPSPESNLIGADAVANKARADAASPEAATRALPAGTQVPPVLLIHGTADRRVSPLQSARMRDTLAAAGGDVTFLTVEGGGHGGDGFDAMVAPSLAHITTHMTTD